MSKKILLILFIIPFLLGASPTRVNNFSSETTIRALEVNEDLDNLYGYLHTGVDTLRAGAVNLITEIASAIRSGSDATVVTGTKGTTGQLCVWNGDGDAVALTTLTGNTVGVGISVPMILTNYTSCTSLGTDASGNVTCN